MITKSVEIRDRATFIPAIAIKMVPGDSEAERYLLWRCGYSTDHPAVILLRMDGAWGSPAPAILTTGQKGRAPCAKRSCTARRILTSCRTGK